MAYPTVSGPYGFQPINLIGGQVFAGSTRLFPIASGSGTSIFYGDVVRLNTGGTLSKVSTTATATDAVGIFLGCQFTNPTTKQLLQQQYYPASTVASDIQAFVLDDPDALFKVAVTAAGASTISGVTQAAIGQNSALILTAGSTTTGDSLASISATTGAGTALPMRIVAGVPETVNASGSFTEVIVKFNFGVHTYYSAAGVATAA
jgi:hypothetical protein